MTGKRWGERHDEAAGNAARRSARDRRGWRRAAAIGVLALTAAVPLLARDFSAAPPAAARPVPGIGDFVGPATCDSTNCHGSARPRDGRVRQDEFITWFRDDPHRHAFDVLGEPLGQQMGRRLGIDVQSASECLVCHASPSRVASTGTGAGGGAPAGRTTNASPAAASSAAGASERGGNIAEFGVSCEACHGAASGWYGAHFQRGFERAAAVANLGLVDTKAPAALAARCFECHLGDATRVVDHRLIAAGHPDLAFETGSYLLATHPHWRQRGAASRDWFLRATLVGQLVGVQVQLEQVGREVGGASPVDWSNRDCASCHHDLADAGWKQLRDWRLDHAQAVPLGQALFDASRFPAAIAVARALDAAAGESLAAALTQVEKAAHAAPFDARELAEAAQAAATLARRLAGDLAARREVEALARSVGSALAAEAERVVGHGLASAEQAGQLLHSLRLAFTDATWEVERGGPADVVRARLLAPLDTPRTYTPADLARAWREVAGEQ